MFIILLILIVWRENIATPSGYIFVFDHEVFNIVTRVFLLPYKLYFLMMSCAPIHPLEIFLRLSLQSISPASSEYNTNGTSGRQRISANGVQPSGYPAP